MSIMIYGMPQSRAARCLWMARVALLQRCAR